MWDRFETWLLTGRVGRKVLVGLAFLTWLAFLAVWIISGWNGGDCVPFPGRQC